MQTVALNADPDRRAVGERLVAAALAEVGPAEYFRLVPPGWHDDPATAQERMAILAGARPRAERIPPEALDLLDDVVEIPMVGMGASLNVAVAASLVLYKLAGLA